MCVCNSCICVSYTSYGTNAGNTYYSTSTSRDSKEFYTTSSSGNTPRGPTFGCWAATSSEEIWKGYQTTKNFERLCFELSLVFSKDSVFLLNSAIFMLPFGKDFVDYLFCILRLFDRVETKYIVCVIFIDVSVCAKEERECSVQRLNEQECRAHSRCTCRTYGNWTVWAGVEWVSCLGIE